MILEGEPHVMSSKLLSWNLNSDKTLSIDSKEPTDWHKISCEMIEQNNKYNLFVDLFAGRV